MASFIQGYVMAKQLQMQQAQNQRAQEMHQVQVQQQKIQLQSMRRDIQFLQGRDKAVSHGGLPELLDYLDNTRPEEGQALRMGQSQLNNSILQGAKGELEVFEKNQQLLGNVYSQLHQLDPAQRQKVYEDVLPQLRKLDPDAPDKYDQGRAIMSISQALPASYRYTANKQASQAQTQVGKAYQDKQKLLEQGADSNSDVIKSLDAEIEAGTFERAKALSKATELEMKAVKDRASTAKIFADRYDKATKDYKVLLENYTKAQGLYAEAAGLNGKDPNAAAQTTLATLMARAASPGVVTDEDFARAAKTDSWMAQLWQMKNRAYRGDLLTRKEVENVMATFEGMKVEQDKMYEPIIDQFKKLAKKSGLDEEDVVLDLKKGINKKTPEQKVKMLQETYPTKDITRWLTEAKRLNPQASEEELIDALEKQLEGAK